MAGELSGNHQPNDNDLIAWADNIDHDLTTILAWNASSIPLDPAGNSALVGPTVQGALETLLAAIQSGTGGSSGDCFLD